LAVYLARQEYVWKNAMNSFIICLVFFYLEVMLTISLSINNFRIFADKPTAALFL